MKTRKVRHELEVRKTRMRLLEARLRVAPFYNPYKSYKIGGNFFFDEVDGEPRTNMPAFFKWNRIVSAVNHADRIVFSFAAINQDSMVDERYAVERFKSFGRRDLKEFAVKLEQLATHCRYTVEESSLFPQVQQLMKKNPVCDWINFHGDFQQGLPRYRTMEISHAVCKQFNVAPEQVMMRCVKYGDLPIKHTSISNEAPFDLCMKFLNLLLMDRTMARQRNIAAIQQLSDMGKATHYSIYVTLDNVTGHAKYSVAIPSPNTILFFANQIKEQLVKSYQWQDLHHGLVDLEEYEAIMTTTKERSRSFKYPINRKLICKHRERQDTGVQYAEIIPPTTNVKKEKDQ